MTQARKGINCMKTHEILERLAAEGTAQNRKVYARHGVALPMYGVSYGALGKLRKQIKTNHQVAVALWGSGNHDARVLACMVADPEKMTVGQLNAWSKDLANYVLTDALAGLAAKTPHAESRLTLWTKSQSEWISSAGWGILSSLAVAESSTPDAFFVPWIDVIVTKIHGAPNRSRHTMNNALIAIGVRSTDLAALATEAAGRVGVVTVDHGETNCTTPDAAAYIRKTLDHYAAKGKPKKRKRC